MASGLFFPLPVQVHVEVSLVSPMLAVWHSGGLMFPFRWPMQFQQRHAPRQWSEHILQHVYPSFMWAALSLMSIANSLSPPAPPPGSLQWTISQMYYVSLITAEIFGPTNASQIINLSPNANNIYTPGYMIYKNGNPTIFVLFNFITEPLGFSDYNVTFAISSSGANQPNVSPQQVSVQYFTTPSVASKGNFQWAGQVHTAIALIASANGN